MGDDGQCTYELGRERGTSKVAFSGEYQSPVTQPRAKDDGRDSSPEPRFDTHRFARDQYHDTLDNNNAIVKHAKHLLGVPSQADLNLTLGIIGLGYVGLPTAIGFLDAGYNVWGVDVSNRTVDMIRAGQNPTGDPGLDGIVPGGLANSASSTVPGRYGRWNVTTSAAEAVPHCDVVLVTVPTPVSLDLKPNLSHVEAAGRSVFEAIKDGAYSKEKMKGSKKMTNKTIVVLESTVYPGVTSQTWKPIIKELGLILGKDVEIAYCPERLNPGDAAHGVRSVARVIGCADPLVGQFLVELYSTLTDGNVRYVGGIEVAEAAKVIENVQRDVNIALVNELACVLPALGVDVEDVLSAAATKWNFHRYVPGVGVGGHCIPVDPYYLMQRARDAGVPTRLIDAARTVNRDMPKYLARELVGILQDAGIAMENARVLFLGWSYKPEVGDPRETPAEPLAEALRNFGIEVGVFDPHLNNKCLPSSVRAVDDVIAQSKGYHLAVMVTAHRACITLNWKGLMKSMAMPIIYDGRRVLDLRSLSKMGWKVHAVGRSSFDVISESSMCKEIASPLMSMQRVVAVDECCTNKPWALEIVHNAASSLFILRPTEKVAKLLLPCIFFVSLVVILHMQNSILLPTTLVVSPLGLPWHQVATSCRDWIED